MDLLIVAGGLYLIWAAKKKAGQLEDNSRLKEPLNLGHMNLAFTGPNRDQAIRAEYGEDITDLTNRNPHPADDLFGTGKER